MEERRGGNRGLWQSQIHKMGKNSFDGKKSLVLIRNNLIWKMWSSSPFCPNSDVWSGRETESEWIQQSIVRERGERKKVAKYPSGCCASLSYLIFVTSSDGVTFYIEGSISPGLTKKRHFHKRRHENTAQLHILELLILRVYQYVILQSGLPGIIFLSL